MILPVQPLLISMYLLLSLTCRLASGSADAGSPPVQEASFSFDNVHEEGGISDSAQSKAHASESISEFMAAQLQRQRKQRCAEGVLDSSDSSKPLTS